ncbi:MAG: hypothetical protein ABIA37_03990 [Candidatus Woesearchaeota archaeon]
MSSLKEESLESRMGENYDLLHREYIQQADQAYLQAFKKDEELNLQRKVCYFFSAVGLPAYVLSDYHPMSLLPLGVGLFQIIRSYTRRRSKKKKALQLLEKRTKRISQKDLEKRLKEKDYSIPPEPSAEEILDYEVKQYSALIKETVRKKEYGLVNYPLELGGAGIGLFGCFEAQHHPYRGMTWGIIGAVLFLGSGLWKNRQLRKVEQKTKDYLKEHPAEMRFLKDRDLHEYYKKKIERKKR